MTRKDELHIASEQHDAHEHHEVGVHHEGNRWTFKKDVSVGNILTMAGLIVGLFAWGNAIERRLTILEEKSSIHIATDARQDQTLKEAKDEQRQRLDRIEDKLDAALSAMRLGQLPQQPERSTRR